VTFLVSFSVRPGIIASLVISISPDKAGPPVTGRGIPRLHKRSAEDGETLAGMRAGFQAEIHNKGWQTGYGRRKGNHVAAHEDKNAMKRDSAG
jgi:hypothetical protein